MSHETDNPWQTRASKVVYDNPWIRVREDQVIRPDGAPGIYGVVHFKHIAIGILPVADGHVYLVGQYRYTLGRYSWEIPEGGCPADEDPLSAASRELAEETGLRAGRWQKMGAAHLSNSVTDELAIWFLATELTQGEHKPEGTERLCVRRVSLADAGQMLLRGEITDAISVMALMQYQLEQTRLAGRPADGSREA
ncbi:MAG TPA: NUDIX hydrolase [Pyrinomonadaceae bacterium]|jgi:8-oxo-dGTP pyrophosphatase MutT (NUDIX family)